MARKFSCREPVYASWQDAVELLPDAGIHYFEAQVRPAEELAAVVSAAKEHAVKVLTVAGGVNLDAEDSVTNYLAGLDAAAQFEVPIAFTSASGSEKGRDHYMGRLKELAEEAEGRGVVISLETHPPFCQNAAWSSSATTIGSCSRNACAAAAGSSMSASATRIRAYISSMAASGVRGNVLTSPPSSGCSMKALVISI